MILTPTVNCKFLVIWQTSISSLRNRGVWAVERRSDQIYHINLLKHWMYLLCQLWLIKTSKMIRACNSQQISSRTYSDWKFISSMFSLQSSAKPTPGHREGCTEDASVKRMVKPMVPLHGNSAEKRWIPTVLQWLSKVQQVPDKYLMPSVDEITKCLRMSYYTLYYIGLAGYYWRFCLTLLTWANL